VAITRASIVIRDKLGPLLEPAVAFVVGSISLFILHLFHIGSPSDYATFSAGIFLTAASVFFVKRAERHHTILIEITMSYLIHGGKFLLDELLDKMISGRWHSEGLKPGDALFHLLEENCTHGDYWLKRKIAEALPVLGRLDPKRTVRLIAILRDDWDPEWKTDLRRRAIESLTLPPFPNQIPLIFHAKADDIEPLLKLREGDQIYTAFATVEALLEWRSSQPKKVEALLSLLRSFTEVKYSAGEREAIESLILLLKMANGANVSQVLTHLTEMSQSTNEVVRVAAARNITLISDVFPEKTFDLIELLGDRGQPKNVRRPIAREKCIDFIVKSTTSKKPQEKQRASKLLSKLAADPEKIIRAAVLDKIGALSAVNAELTQSICELVRNSETDAVLKGRAEKVMEELKNAGS